MQFLNTKVVVRFKFQRLTQHGSVASVYATGFTMRFPILNTQLKSYDQVRGK